MLQRQSGHLRILGLFGALLALLALTCTRNENRSELAERMAELDNSADDAEALRRIKRDISAVDLEVEKTIESVRDLGTYWRLLGLKYMDYQMWGKAVEAFDKAIGIDSNNAVLLYKRALSAGQMALSLAAVDARRGFVAQAETGYRRVLDIDPRYTPAMYALAVVLVYETGEYREAAHLLENYLRIERSDMKARFLLANAYVNDGQLVAALDVCDVIIRTAENQEDKHNAKNFYQRISEGIYGS